MSSFYEEILLLYNQKYLSYNQLKKKILPRIWNQELMPKQWQQQSNLASNKDEINYDYSVITPSCLSHTCTLAKCTETGPIGMMLNKELEINGGSATQKWLFHIDVFSRWNCCTSNKIIFPRSINLVHCLMLSFLLMLKTMYISPVRFIK